ncbi:alpha/beta hydrolase [Mesorhizobium loti]|uniref:Esterase n=1 Tax=Mesorhizobium loti R88b TaxID=935548 RepID=A0A6M7WD23_RHILI|nr:alpha/beta fold hydrolase [Mesorhizobium loti]QKD01650.1 esterase [Mesorhizobium loti R88b]
MQFRFVEPSAPSSPPLIFLHGSGGNETDMLPVAAAAAPGAAAFSVRGAVKWEDGYAFFGRFPDRSIDEDSIRAEAPALAAFIADTIAAHYFQSKPILVGFSNGAIMAAALVMLFPNLVQGAALLRPLSPFAMPTETRLPATPVLVIDALNDARRQVGDGLDMASQLRDMGAIVTHHSLPTGHDLTEGDLDLLRGWLMKRNVFATTGSRPCRRP